MSDREILKKLDQRFDKAQKEAYGGLKRFTVFPHEVNALMNIIRVSGRHVKEGDITLCYRGVKIRLQEEMKW